MIANYEYVLAKCKALCADGLILDYGCGGGEVVFAGRTGGLDILGVEAFYAGSNAKLEVENKNLLGTVVLELNDRGVIPFENEKFDLVISNQVFEHVENLDFVTKEIARVLRPGGRLLALFPAREVIREGHCGVPMVHWFPKDSAIRFPYMCFMRMLGLGYFKMDKPRQVWARDFIDWLDRYTFYRAYKEIAVDFRAAGFQLQHIEEDYIAFRLSLLGLSRLGSLSLSRVLRPFTRSVCRHLGGMVILATKE